MPYVQLADGTEIWYRTNMPIEHGAPVWDENKPTVLLLQGMALTAFTELKMRDPTMSAAFNLISFDARSTGNTRYTFDARRDTWMDAADLAEAILLLALPPLHVFTAGGVLAHQHALKLALLWDEVVETITFVEAGARPEDTSEFQVNADIINEVTRDVSAYEDLDILETMSYEMCMYIFGKGVSEDTIDVMVENFEVNYSGRKTFRFFDYMMEVFQEASLDSSLLDRMTKPILYVKSDRTTLSRPDISVKPAELRRSKVNLEVLKSPPQPHLVEPWATQIHSIFQDFVFSRASQSTGSRPTIVDIPGHMSRALKCLADLVRRPDLAERDPMMPVSFSLTSEEVIRKRQPLADEFICLCDAKVLGKVLDDNGKPFRKYSERNAEDYCLLKAPLLASKPIIGITSMIENVEIVED